MTAINFKASKQDAGTIEAIVLRAENLRETINGQETDRLSLTMDLTATHLNGTPLCLADLLAADDFNFAHDVFGIERHINRRTGKLQNCFLPRFAA